MCSNIRDNPAKCERIFQKQWKTTREKNAADEAGQNKNIDWCVIMKFNTEYFFRQLSSSTAEVKITLNIPFARLSLNTISAGTSTRINLIWIIRRINGYKMIKFTNLHSSIKYAYCFIVISFVVSNIKPAVDTTSSMHTSLRNFHIGIFWELFELKNFNIL